MILEKKLVFPHFLNNLKRNQLCCKRKKNVLLNLRISFFKDIIKTEVQSKFDICENKVEEEYFCKLHNGAKHH